MSDVNRRDIVKLAGVLAIASAALGATAAQEPNKPTIPPLPAEFKDDLLVRAHTGYGFMLGSPVTIELPGTSGQAMVITTALGADGKKLHARVPSRSMIIFRADAGVDEFTKQGGLRWRQYDQSGEVKLGKLGAFSQHDHIVMVVREDRTVRFYTTTSDLRC